MSSFVIFDDETLRQSAAAGYRPAILAIAEIERQRAQGIDAVAGCSEAGMMNVCSRAFALMRAASADRSPEGGGPEEGRHAKHESAPAESGDAQPTPVSDPISNKGER